MHFGRDSRCVFIVLKSSPSTGARPGWISGLGSENVGTMWELARSPTPENSEHARIVETPPVHPNFVRQKKEILFHVRLTDLEAGETALIPNVGRRTPHFRNENLPRRTGCPTWIYMSDFTRLLETFEREFDNGSARLPPTAPVS